MKYRILFITLVLILAASGVVILTTKFSDLGKGKLIATPVPIAKWIKQDIPEDTKIDCDLFRWHDDYNSHVTFYADGTVLSTIHDPLHKVDKRGTGQISLEELKQILLKFADVDFFSLRSESNCVYNVNHPPTRPITECGQIDGIRVTISITMNGITNGITYGFLGKEFENLLELPVCGIRFIEEP